MLARLPAQICVHGEDVVEPYMLFTNSHDGSIAIDFRLTAIRVVCQNTLSLALSQKKTGMIFKHAHQGNYAGMQREADEFFQLCLKATAGLGKRFNAMSQFDFDGSQFKLYVDSLIPLPPRPAGDVTPRLIRLYETRLQKAQQMRDGIAKAYYEGVRNELVVPPSESTLWGAFNAVTAFVDHAQPIGETNRFVNSMFGSGASLKRSAYTMALNYLPTELKQPSLFD